MADNVSNRSRIHASRYSRSSSRSSTAAAAAIAQAAKTRLAFIDKELKIRMELEKLQLEKETAAAVAEAEVLREAADELKERSSCNHSKLDCTPADPSTRVREYLADQASQPKQEMTGPQPPLNEQIVQGYQYGRFERGDRLLPHRPGSPDRPTQTTPPIISYHSPNSRVEDTEPPNDRYPTNTRDASQSQYTSDLVRYFTRRELITTGLPPFNDRPEDYRAWKRSFQSAIRHLGLTYSEEMDLLVKWLGKESGGTCEEAKVRPPEPPRKRAHEKYGPDSRSVTGLLK
ncbi:unnamed protein product [Acanthosepion pharaonis]|uniref:Uncharacterized protein n=1 Tax=Acanthosepion pharaonis TaxID=158019 RepID=A0A812CNR4_ACAPH|nr:unnamed protein product [Sepia pharaonis]